MNRRGPNTSHQFFIFFLIQINRVDRDKGGGLHNGDRKVGKDIRRNLNDQL